jgi:hypothetical protein
MSRRHVVSGREELGRQKHASATRAINARSGILDAFSVSGSLDSAPGVITLPLL